MTGYCATATLEIKVMDNYYNQFNQAWISTLSTIHCRKKFTCNVAVNNSNMWAKIQMGRRQFHHHTRSIYENHNKALPTKAHYLYPLISTLAVWVHRYSPVDWTHKFNWKVDVFRTVLPLLHFCCISCLIFSQHHRWLSLLVIILSHQPVYQFLA